MAPTPKAARQEGKRDVEYAFALRVIAADGSATELSHTCEVPWQKLPAIGQRLPVTIDRADPARLRIEWHRTPDAADRARASADAAARGDAAGAAEALGFELRDSRLRLRAVPPRIPRGPC